MMATPIDPHGIVPAGVGPNGGYSRSVDLQVRTLLEFDMNFMQDRVRSDLYVDGRPLGLYGVAVVDDRMLEALGPIEVLRRLGPQTERLAIEELVGLNQRSRVSQLEAEVRTLQDAIKHLTRPRWWTFPAVRREWRIARLRLADLISPPVDPPAAS